MKCEECLLALDEYEYGELEESASGRVAAHLIGCRACADEQAELRREREIFAGREAKAPSTLWAAVASRIESEKAARASTPLARVRAWLAGSLAGLPLRLLPAAAVAAVVVVACAALLAYVARQDGANKAGVEALAGNSGGATNRPELTETPRLAPAASPERASTDGPAVADVERLDARRSPRVEGRARLSAVSPANTRTASRELVGVGNSERTLRRAGRSGLNATPRESAAESELDVEAARHLEKAQMLLRSFKNERLSQDERALDIVYEKRFSRDLLGKNILLRGDAQSAGNEAVEQMLSRLEPFLLDIANLQESRSDEQVRLIQERMRREGIVESLRLF